MPRIAGAVDPLLGHHFVLFRSGWSGKLVDRHD